MLNPKFLGIGIAGIVIILVVISISDFQVSETNNDDILLDENDIIKEIDFQSMIAGEDCVACEG